MELLIKYLINHQSISGGFSSSFLGFSYVFFFSFMKFKNSGLKSESESWPDELLLILLF